MELTDTLLEHFSDMEDPRCHHHPTFRHQVIC